MLGRLALVIAERADGVLTIEHRPQLAGLPFLYVVHTISQHARRSLPPLAIFPILHGGRGLRLGDLSMQKKSWSELFEDVIIQLDSAAGEAREAGAEELALILHLLF